MTASIILADAALREGKNVVQSQNYGPEVRGGHSTAYVIISGESILYPKVDRPNLLVVMSGKDHEPYLKDISEEGLLLVDGEEDSDPLPANVYRIPITHIAHDEVERPITANIVCLGAIVGLTDLVSVGAAIAAMEASIPPRAVVINRKAFTLGLQAARKAREKRAAELQQPTTF